MAPPEMWILAGPNGAGKTTLAKTHFREFIRRGGFLNADETAVSISPDFPGKAAIRAGRALIAARTAAIREKRSFTIETTLATETLIHAVVSAKNAGYRTGLAYLWIIDPDLCIQRVAARVAEGGHYIPSDVVVRRYRRSLALLPKYLAAVDVALIYSANAAPQLVARKDRDGLKVIRARDWQRISSGFP